jgi:hypothetical protein
VDGDESGGHDVLHHVVLFEAPVQRPEPIKGKLSQLFPEAAHTQRLHRPRLGPDLVTARIVRALLLPGFGSSS